MKIKINKIKKNESFQFLGLLLLTALVLYFIPAIKSIFFLVTLYLFFKSKRDYFWLAYFFTIVMDIGGFFYYLTEDILQIGPAKISLFFLYAIVSFFKVKRKNIRTPFFLERNINLWILYLFISVYIGMFIYGNRGGGSSGYRYFFLVIMMIPAITTLYTTPKFIRDEAALINFSKLIFFTIVLNLVGQFLHLFLNEPLNSFFIEKEVIEQGPDYVEKNFTTSLIRPVWGVIHSLIAVFLSIYWSVHKRSKFKNSYLMLILALSIFSIFITATRGWIIAVLIFIVSSLFLMNLENKFRILRLMMMVMFSFTLLYSFYEPVQIQTDQVFERLTTLEDLAKGDITAGGTNVRLTNRSKPVMELFYKRPIFGSGFSYDGLETSDQHVGNQTALMGGGIVGYMIIMLIWCRIMNTSLKAHKSNLFRRNYNGEILLIIPLLFSILIIHSSSTSLFSYTDYSDNPDKLFLLAVFFAIMNQVILNKKQLWLDE